MNDAGGDLHRWVDGARRGDAEASRALVEGLYPLVIRIVRGHLPVRVAEEDLAQQVFVKLFGRLDQYSPRAGVPFEHWVSRLAVRTCLDALRAERRRPEVRWSDLPEGQSAWLEYMLDDRTEPPDGSSGSARELLEKLLGQLSVEDRLVITLLDLEAKSVKEISGVTGWSVAGVKVRAFRARRRLRKMAETFKAGNPHERL